MYVKRLQGFAERFGHGVRSIANRYGTLTEDEEFDGHGARLRLMHDASCQESRRAEERSHVNSALELPLDVCVFVDWRHVEEVENG